MGAAVKATPPARGRAPEALEAKAPRIKQEARPGGPAVHNGSWGPRAAAAAPGPVRSL